MSLELQKHFLAQESEVQECLLALAAIVKESDENITMLWKFGMPFFYYDGKMLCYLWMHKKLKCPYISFNNANKLKNKKLLSEGRKRFKIFLVNHTEDIPKEEIESLILKAVSLCK